LEIYSVKSSDILFSIAQKYAVSHQSIINTNDLTEPQRLVVGMNLVIPTKVPKVESKASIETLGYFIASSYKEVISVIDGIEQSFTYLGICYFYFNQLGEMIEEFDINILELDKFKKISMFPVVTNLSEGNFSS